MFSLVQDWGPESLLAVVVLLLVAGLLVPSRSLKRLQAERDQLLRQKDNEYTNIVQYYEKRICDLKEIHSEIASGLRTTQDITQRALTHSVQNVTRLTAIVDEYAELTRVVTPALMAARNVLEGPPNDQS
jgi:hypothetical protein